MSKRNRIIYWFFNIWLALGMFSTGIVQVFKLKTATDFTANLGYPGYFLTIIGIWKMLGVVAILIPRFPLLKEWAYAGFFFVMTGAIFSHLAMRESVNTLFPPLLLLILTIISWCLRPADRKIMKAGR